MWSERRIVEYLGFEIHLGSRGAYKGFWKGMPFFSGFVQAGQLEAYNEAMRRADTIISFWRIRLLNEIAEIEAEG